MKVISQLHGSIAYHKKTKALPFPNSTSVYHFYRDRPCLWQSSCCFNGTICCLSATLHRKKLAFNNNFMWSVDLIWKGGGRLQLPSLAPKLKHFLRYFFLSFWRPYQTCAGLMTLVRASLLWQPLFQQTFLQWLWGSHPETLVPPKRCLSTHHRWPPDSDLGTDLRRLQNKKPWCTEGTQEPRGLHHSENEKKSRH